MKEETFPGARLKIIRERAGMDEVRAAGEMGLSLAQLWDIESFDGDLTSCYSPHEVRRFCQVLGIRPDELFGDAISEPPVSASELVQLIHEQCRLRGLTLEQFEDVVGWRLSACIDPPEKLLEEITIDGLQWLCKELGIDWRRSL